MACECSTLTTEDALTMRSLEVVSIHHNACAPVNYYVCKCKSCGAQWSAIEVYDEGGQLKSQWSWERCE